MEQKFWIHSGFCRKSTSLRPKHIPRPIGGQQWAAVSDENIGRHQVCQAHHSTFIQVHVHICSYQCRTHSVNVYIHVLSSRINLVETLYIILNKDMQVLSALCQGRNISYLSSALFLQRYAGVYEYSWISVITKLPFRISKIIRSYN